MTLDELQTVVDSWIIDQPIDWPEKNAHHQIIAYSKSNPKWRLSVQTHKILWIP